VLHATQLIGHAARLFYGVSFNILGADFGTRTYLCAKLHSDQWIYRRSGML